MNILHFGPVYHYQVKTVTVRRNINLGRIMRASQEKNMYPLSCYFNNEDKKQVRTPLE